MQAPGGDVNHAKTFQAYGLASLGRSGLRLLSFKPLPEILLLANCSQQKRRDRDLNRTETFLLASLCGLRLVGFKSVWRS